MLGKIKIGLKKMSKKVSVFYYLFLFKDLQFKFAALRNGMKQNEIGQGRIFNLRRNIHRLEKGLSYSNTKPVFATDYILQTIRLYDKVNSENALNKPLASWANSVLEEYFRVCDHTNEKIAEAYRLFESNKISAELAECYPYPIEKRKQSSIQYNDLLDLSLQRRSIRYFTDEKVSVELIEKCFEVAKLAPSACNRQSFRYLFYNDREKVAKLSSIPGGVSGYDLYNLVVVVGDYAGYFSERDVNAPIIDASLSSMSFLYACETLGLGTVCINWPNLVDREKRIRKEINLKSSEFVIMMIGLGYPAAEGKIPYSMKRANEDFLLINKRT